MEAKDWVHEKRQESGEKPKDRVRMGQPSRRQEEDRRENVPSPLTQQADGACPGTRVSAAPGGGRAGRTRHSEGTSMENSLETTGSQHE